MTVLRYYDKPEYEEAKKKAGETSNHAGKLKTRGATMWLRGETHERTPDEIAAAASSKGYKAAKRYMVTDEVIERTQEKLAGDAEKTGKKFHKGMPSGAKFFPYAQMEPKLLDRYPHLGVCQFAEIPVRAKQGDIIVTLYLANFDARITMNPEDEFFRVHGPEYSEMYFGIAWRKNASGEFEIATDIGQRGLMFQTKDQTKAFDNAVHLATGIPVSTWKQRLQRAQEALYEANRAAANGLSMKAL